MDAINRQDEGTCIGCNGTGTHEDPETCERYQCGACGGSGDLRLLQRARDKEADRTGYCPGTCQAKEWCNRA